MAHFVYYYTIKYYGDYEIFYEGNIIWSLLVSILNRSTSLTDFHVFDPKTQVAVGMLHDAGLEIGRNIFVTGAIALLIMTNFGLALAYVVKAFKMNKFFFTPKLKYLATYALGAGVLTDVVTAGSLSFFLRRFRTGIETSDSVVNRLTVYAINTGALTSTVSLATLLLYNFQPTSFYFMAAYSTLTKLYAISFLCTLHTRKVISGKGTDGEEGMSNVVRTQGNSFYMVDVNGQRGHHMSIMNSPYSSPIKSIEIGVFQDVSVRSDDLGPLRSPDPLLPASARMR
ncbi:hypothetical protein D9615_005755 [Tricholomella constricta]|uniref:DUF6534 domain-containing protein n=1 Tax=Tricholomella constricta TaxID=117010 RepID=A0A8H5HAE4_9AGAR|nr:hypothetical protein D9615_005755 [Tricholomella constricta]